MMQQHLSAPQPATRQGPGGRQLHSTKCVGFVAAHSHLSTSRGLVAARAGGVSSRARSRVATAAAAYSKDATGLSSLRFAKPEGDEMAQLMSEWESRDCNHSFAGASANAPDLPDGVTGGGFMITKTRRQVGNGPQDFKAAVDAVKQWAHLQLPSWNCTTTPAMKVGTTICSATQTVVPWSVLPARVTYMKEGAAKFEGGTGKRFSVGMSSLEGHQLAGEERFAVDMLPDGSVWYDVFLFSKPDTLLALVSLPVVKLMQLRYVNDSAAAVAKAVQ